MGLTAIQEGGTIKLVWTYPFWLDFYPTYDEQQYQFTTNRLTVPYGCTLYMDLSCELCNATFIEWWINDRMVSAFSGEQGWINRTVMFNAGDILLIKMQMWRKEDTYATMVLRLNDANGTKVAEFDFAFRAACFLTTAMVNYYDRDDAGPELTAMRRLRGRYIDKPGYEGLIDEYYRLSAQIIKGIEAEDAPGTVYEQIYWSVKTCENAVASGHWGEAHDEYLNLYYRLVQRYCPDRKGAIVDDAIRWR